jgi:hypothetical protein
MSTSKKYKCIKRYPTGPEVGCIAYEDTVGCYSLTDCSVVRADEIEGHPEFWEEVDDKGWEIIGQYYYDLLMFGKPKEWIITSIKRTSDNVAFLLGDKIKMVGHAYNKPPEPITKIKLNSEGIPCLFTDTFHNHGINIFKAIKCESVLMTEDYVEIFKGDDVYWMRTRNFTEKEPEFYYEKYDWSGEGDINLTGTYRWFSTKEAAEKWISKNKVLITTDDGVNLCAGDSFWFVDRYFNASRGVIPGGNLGSLFKALNNHRHFSTEQAAKNWIDLNRPKYSKRNVLDALKDAGSMNINQVIYELTK